MKNITNPLDAILGIRESYWSIDCLKKMGTIGIVFEII